MITIYNYDNTTQVVNVSPLFFHTVVYGSGKFKRILTPLDKAIDIARDSSPLVKGFTLMNGEELVGSRGETTINKETVQKQPLNQREAFKNALVEWKLDVLFQNNIAAQHGLSAKQIWNKKATLIKHSSSTYVKQDVKPAKKKLALV